MSDPHALILERLIRLGYARDKQVKLYGQLFELVSDPIFIGELVVVDGLDVRSGTTKRITIPLSILTMVRKAA